jgi:hypothetical protein
MVDDNNIIEEIEKGGEVKPKKKAKTTKKKAVKAKTMDIKRKEGKDDNYLFTLVIVTVVILGIIGIIFGYTKDKLSELKKGGTEVTKELENEVNSLKKKLSAMQDKTAEMEKETEINKDVVIDLFDKNRTIPTNVNAVEWKELGLVDLTFSVSFPQTWEMVRPIIETQAEEGVPVDELIYLQPIGQELYTGAITLKNDYADFSKISLEAKIEIFSELDVVDSVDFSFGKMIYFINLDQDNKEVPTILILTEDNIYRATFNVSDKKTSNYFEYRKDFEEIISTFIMMPEVEEEALAEEDVLTGEE